MKKHEKYLFQFVIDNFQNGLKDLAVRMDALRISIDGYKNREKMEWQKFDQIAADRLKGSCQFVERKTTFQSEDIILYSWATDGFHLQKKSILNTIRILQAKRQKLEKQLCRHRETLKYLYQKLLQYEAHKMKLELIGKESLARFESKIEEDLQELKGTHGY